MNPPIKTRSLALAVTRSRFPRALACFGAALFFMIASVLWQPGKPAQALGRLTINTGEGEAFTLPEARVGTAYEFQFQPDGGLPPLKWSVVAGAIPPGLRLEENGKLRGSPDEAKAEAYAFVVEVADSAKTPQKASLPCLLMVNAAPLRIVTPAPKLRIVTKDSENPPSAQAINNHQSGIVVGAQIADVSNPAVVGAGPAVSIIPASASVLPPRTTDNRATGPSSAAAASIQDDKVQIVFPQDKAIVNQQQYTLAIKIAPSIERLSVVVRNEKKEEIKRQIELGRKNEYSALIKLDEGKNTILVIGADADGNETKKGIEITRRGEIDSGGKITFYSIMPEGAKPKVLSENSAPSVHTQSKNNLLEARVVDGNGQPVKQQQVTFKIVNGDGQINGGPEASVTTDSNGVASAKFDSGNIPGVTKIKVETPSFLARATSLDLFNVDLARWRYVFHIGAEFNNSANTGFGKQFLNVGLTTNTHWGDSFHTEFEARLTSVLQRDLLTEATEAKERSTTPEASAVMRVLAGDEQETNLTPFFSAKKALEVSTSVFWDKFKLFRGGVGNDRARFGPIIKYQFRTRIDRSIETEKAELQRLINETNGETERQALQDKLDKLNQIAPPPKNALSEIFAGLRIANYDNHYSSETEYHNPEEVNGDNSLDCLSFKNGKPDCNEKRAKYRRNFYRNIPSKAYFHIMWGASQQFQNEDRKLVLRRDAQGRPIPDANGDPQFDVKRFNHIGRFLLEGYMDIPKTRLGLRFNGNLGPGEDEIRFSFLVPVDLNRLRRTINLF